MGADVEIMLDGMYKARANYPDSASVISVLSLGKSKVVRALAGKGDLVKKGFKGWGREREAKERPREEVVRRRVMSIVALVTCN